MTDLQELADRVALHELVARHGHLVDRGDLAGLAEVFVPDDRARGEHRPRGHQGTRGVRRPRTVRRWMRQPSAVRTVSSS